MHIHEQHRPAIFEPKKSRAQHRTRPQIEGPPSVLRCEPSSGLLTPPLAHSAQVRHGQPEAHLLHDLAGLPISRREPGAQHLVTPQNFPHASGQPSDVKRPFEQQRHGNVVDLAIRGKAIEKPHPLLREGKRQSATVGPHDRWRHQLPTLAQRPFHPACQPLHRGLFEEVPQRHLHIESPTKPRDHPCGRQRMSAEREEIVVSPDPLHPEHLAPHRGDDLLHPGARSHKSRRTQPPHLG